MPIYIFFIQVEYIFAYEEKYGLEDHDDLDIMKENSMHHTRKVRNADVSELCQPTNDKFHSQVVSLLLIFKEKKKSAKKR